MVFGKALAALSSLDTRHWATSRVCPTRFLGLGLLARLSRRFLPQLSQSRRLYFILRAQSA